MQIAEALKTDLRRVVAILEADYRGGIVRPAEVMVNRVVDLDHRNAGSLNRTDIPADQRLRSNGVKESDFPLPARVLRFAVPFTKQAAAEVAELRTFARWQAAAANAMIARLRALGREPTPEDWLAEYRRLMDERDTKKRLDPDSLFDTPITDDYPNIDQFGPVVAGEGSVWDFEKRQYVGGYPTPASENYREIGELAVARFRIAGIPGDELQNRVRLSGETEVNGNRILRGESAEQAIRDHIERGAARGFDVSNWRWSAVTPETPVTFTATEADRRLILQDAVDQLARPGAFTTEEWADAAYKLFQSPERKNGSDGVIRTYLAAAAAYRMGRVPVFPHDIDLRAMTMEQRDFVKYVVDHDASAAGA
ncbi:hypothetical protein ABZV91_03020 [Nocardia sp. NPDC004568]|uniref:hypothetical protein n=1 Tax=Nocardia sp. NPDC004568 TaxID=3154551 RepID=UPI0033A23C85